MGVTNLSISQMILQCIILFRYLLYVINILYSYYPLKMNLGRLARGLLRGLHGPAIVGHRGRGPRPIGSGGRGPPANVWCRTSRALLGVNLHHGTITGLNMALGSPGGKGHTIPSNKTAAATKTKHVFVTLLKTILR